MKFIDDFLMLEYSLQVTFLHFKQVNSFFFFKLTDRLSLLLAKERSHSQTYLGCMKKGPVFTDPKLKWFVTKWLPISLQ